MRRLLGSGLALLAAAHLGVAYADPGTPQLSPLHRQREDAQRLDEQLRGLERQRASAVSTPAAEPTRPVAEPARGGGSVAGRVLLVIAGVSGLVTVTLYASGPSDPAADTTARDSATALLGVTTAITGLAGLALVLSNRSVQVAPTVTPKAVGLAISGHL